ncbi:hypothetical protein SS50377_25285 [Spironucleus salmonicida]|uniref:Uncharacterized protein n=1 Tax=Spironucleus salmonicida TaxID=348837 RepID=V6LM91_9EUKA|nr:hypothetical protein SS50377_25285 [Spironucleus salmonicida]|eukprot:EST41834.1 Hypothetical protein SS50377_18668 [Spironucleus salmonicida]
MQKSKSVQRTTIQQPKKPIKTKNQTPNLNHIDMFDHSSPAGKLVEQALKHSERNQNDYLKSFIASSIEQLNPNENIYNIKKTPQLDPQVQEALLESQAQRASLINSILHPKQEISQSNMQQNNGEILRRLSILENQIQYQRQNQVNPNAQDYIKLENTNTLLSKRLISMNGKLKIMKKILQQNQKVYEVEKINQNRYQVDFNLFKDSTTKRYTDLHIIQNKQDGLKQSYDDRLIQLEKKQDRLVEIIRKQKDKIIEQGSELLKLQQNDSNNANQKYFTMISQINQKILLLQQSQDLYKTNFNDDIQRIKQDQASIIEMQQQTEQQLQEVTLTSDAVKMETANVILLLNQQKKVEPNNDLDQIKEMLLEEIIPQIEQLQQDYEEMGNTVFSKTIIKGENEDKLKEDDQINNLFNLSEELNFKINTIQTQIIEINNSIEQIQGKQLLKSKLLDSLNSQQDNDVIFTQLITLTEEKDQLARNIIEIQEQYNRSLGIINENKVRIESLEVVTMEIKSLPKSNSFNITKQDYSELVNKTNAIPIILENLDKINCKVIESENQTEKDEINNKLQLLEDKFNSTINNKEQEEIQDVEQIHSILSQQQDDILLLKENQTHNNDLILIFQEVQKQIDLIQDKIQQFDEDLSKQMLNSEVRDANNIEKLIQESIAFMMNQIDKLKHDIQVNNLPITASVVEDKFNNQYIESLPVQDLQNSELTINQDQINAIQVNITQLQEKLENFEIIASNQEQLQQQAQHQAQEIALIKCQLSEIQSIIDQLEQNQFQIQQTSDPCQIDMLKQQVHIIAEKMHETSLNISNFEMPDSLANSQLQNSIQQLADSLINTEDRIRSLELNVSQFKPDIRKIERDLQAEKLNGSHIDQKLVELHERMNFMQTMFEIQSSQGKQIDIEGIEREYEKMEQNFEPTQTSSLQDDVFSSKID